MKGHSVKTVTVELQLFLDLGLVLSLQLRQLVREEKTSPVAVGLPTKKAFLIEHAHPDLKTFKYLKRPVKPQRLDITNKGRCLHTRVGVRGRDYSNVPRAS
eukprot:gb/GEZN01021895.1/.p1 GENE.gb/GEZN01021895.1/~~gb/GEZN01021895.1/.p1  ORF type:complete len:101 (-),score=2.91 gb/GEZN01021895.1/:186-488(-)